MRTTLNTDNNPIEIEPGKFLNINPNFTVEKKPTAVTNIIKIQKGIFMGLYGYEKDSSQPMHSPHLFQIWMQTN